MCKSRAMCHVTCMEFRAYLWHLILSIPKNQTQVIRFGRKFLYTLSHLTVPSQKILKCLKHCLYCLVQRNFYRKWSFPLKTKKKLRTKGFKVHSRSLTAPELSDSIFLPRQMKFLEQGSWGYLRYEGCSDIYHILGTVPEGFLQICHSILNTFFKWQKKFSTTSSREVA